MFRIQGAVSSREAGERVVGLTILAVDRIEGTPAVMTTATTAEDGTFVLGFELGDLVHLFRGEQEVEVDEDEVEAEQEPVDRRAKLYLYVMRAGVTLAREELSVTLRDLLDGGRCVRLAVDSGRDGDQRAGFDAGGGGRDGCRYFVRGHLRRPDGTAVPSAHVVVVEQRLRHEVVLGETRTDAEGTYLVVYGKPRPCDPARPDKSVFVRAFDARGEESARSRLHCNVPADVTIDLVEGEPEAESRGPSLYMQVWEAVAPRLDGAELHDLDADEAEFLACATGMEVVQVAYLIRSAQLERRTEVARVAFFAFMNAGLPTTLVGILGQDRETQEAALRSGERENTVPPWRAGQIEAILDALHTATLELSVPENDPGSSLLGALLLTGGVDPALPRQFVESWLSRVKPVHEWWQDFEQAYTPAIKKTVQFTLSVGALTGNHLPLVEALQAKRSAEEIEGARDLAKLTAADWLDVLTSGATPPGAPDAIPGENESERNENYAKTLVRVFEDAFPTVAVSAALERAAVLPKVSEFVDLNPDFDFAHVRIDAFLDDEPNLPSGDIEDLPRDLKHVQRLHAISPRFGRGAAVATLMAEGVLSAQQIYKMGYSAFAESFSRQFPDPAVLDVMWQNAAQQAFKVAMAVAWFSAPLNQPTWKIMVAHLPDPEEDGFPDIETLFGSQDFCACEHCRSVFSPAAYLTDLLKFLRDRPGSLPNTSLLDVIKARRPDLVHTLLNCANANTVMPTIDLVNEILERRVKPPEEPGHWQGLQTTWTTEELLAHPEHLHQPAYDELRDQAVHPFVLPFDLRLEEARLYLDHLGVRLADLLEVVHGHDPASTRAIALEILRLSPKQGDILEDAGPGTPAGAYWGLGGSWVTSLDEVRRFLKQASLAYEELLDLLHVDYACMPVGTVAIEHAEGKPCTLEGATFGGTWNEGGDGATRLSRAHRFLRLARRVNWSLYELDAALRALGTAADPLDEAWLVRFAGVHRLLERWPRLNRFELLSWFGAMDTFRNRHDEPSFYERIFLNRSVDPDNESYVLDDGELDDTDRPILQAALNLREEDLRALLNALEAFVGQSPRRNLVWLSRLHRRASLSRALGIPVLDLLRLTSMTGDQPFDDGATTSPDVAQTRAFIEQADRVHASGFSLVELDYLLRHRFEPSEGVALLRDRMQEIFVELIRGLQDIGAETSRDADAATPALTVLGDSLNQVIDETLIEPALDLIEAGNEEPLDSELNDALLKFLGQDDIALLLGKPESTEDLRTVDERAESTLSALLTHIRRTQMAALVIQKLSDAVGLDSGAGEALLHGIEVNGSDGVSLFLQHDGFVHLIDFEADAEAIKTHGFPGLEGGEHDDHFEVLERLHKAAMVVRRFRLRTRNVEWLLEHAGPLELLDLVGADDLPVGDPVPGPAPQWGRWEKLARIVALRDAVFRDPDALFKLLATQSDPDLAPEDRDLLVEGAGWEPDDLDELLDALNVNVHAVRGVDGLERLARAFAMLRRLGVAAERATSWANANVEPAVAQAIKSAARSKHAPEQWPQVIGPLRDELREKQRDALVAHVLAQDPELREPDDLLGELLIDVQGAACQRTSRIVQASASVQLFVQRLLLNLEIPDRLDDASAREWVWRKFYRVWEANRKVFLYPENYVEPELRDDQSPFFRELSADLMDADLTEERAERAYVDYLRKLREVARLKVAGVYHELEHDEGGRHVVVDVLHVIARTFQPPYRYYYRRWVDDSYWTAWEEVPLGIDYPSVMPVVMNRRLMLLWPLFNEVTENVPRTSNKDPRRFLEIQLALSEYVGGGWTQTELSEDTIATNTPGVLIGQSGKSDNIWTDPWPQRNPESVYFETSHNASGELVVTPWYFTAAKAGSAWLHEGVITTPQAFHIKAMSHNVVVRDIDPEYRPWEDWQQFPRPNGAGFRNQYFFVPVSAGEADRQVLLPQRRPDDPTTVTFVEVMRAPTGYDFLVPRHNTRGNPTPRFLSEDPFFYHDEDRTFFIRPRSTAGLPGSAGVADTDDYSLDQGNSVNTGGYFAVLGDPPPAGQGGFKFLGDPVDVGADSDYTPSASAKVGYSISSFQHPFVSRMLEVLDRDGVAGVLNPPEHGDNPDLRRQLERRPVMAQEVGKYRPLDSVRLPWPVDEFEFTHEGAYSLYNWEAFVHGPLLVAQRLRDAQRFDAAQRWYHFVFDPTDSSNDETPRRFWKTKPFYQASQATSITEQLEALAYSGPDQGKMNIRRQMEVQVEQWRKNPFNPHLLARLRPLAYQRATVMKYLDNLIAWGDHLFRQATRETIGEALQLYVLASQILGSRPVRLEARTPDDRSFDDLEEDLDAFSNALVELENVMPPGRFPKSEDITFKAVDTVKHPAKKFTLPVPPPPPQDGFLAARPAAGPGIEPEILLMNIAQDIGSAVSGGFSARRQSGGPRSLYFCIPPNAKMLEYWDTVEDRLFKIRNCLDIEGVGLELPLFQPPIDPALLVKAAAAGIDLASAIAALNAPRPHYRFRAMIPVAKELSAEVRALGQALLTALERKDAEALAELRATHEVRTVEAAERVLQDRVKEARESIVALQAARKVSEARRDYYEELQDEGRLGAEEEGIEKLDKSIQHQQDARDEERTLAGLAFVPDIGVSLGLNAGLTTTIGTSMITNWRAAVARRLSANAGIDGSLSSRSLTKAGFERVEQQWELEIEQAEKDIARIDKEIIAAEVRVEIAIKELENHRKEIAQARERETFLRQRFTRAELYGWMASEVGRVYHQAYQLAYDVAKRAERTYQFELAAEDTSFIQFGYWDNQRKGLLAGDKLLHDIRRMETAYLQNHRRELELTKTVSLAMLDPVALTRLRETGECHLRVPEMLFDLDHPGHFLRRLKSVSVSVPSKTGQLAEVPLTLTLVSSAIRKSTALADDAPDPEALVEDLTSGIQQIATLSAEEDDGMFERNFNDERYLPFEGRGAVGLWRIELPKGFRQFDYGLIGDVVLRLSFTARQGGEVFKDAVESQLKRVIDSYVRYESSFGTGLMNAVSLRKTFPNEWKKLSDPQGGQNPALELDMAPQRFPLRFHGGTVFVRRMWLLAVFRDGGLVEPSMSFDLDVPTATTSATFSIVVDQALSGVQRIRSGDAPEQPHPPSQEPVLFGDNEEPQPPAPPTTGVWRIELADPSEVPEALEDLIIVTQYEVE